MNKNHLITILGILTAITPFTGFPQQSKTFLFVIFGLLISILSYLLSRKQGNFQPRKGDIFEESDNASFQSNNSGQNSLLNS